MLGMVSLVLFLSAKLENAMKALAIALFVILLPIFVSYSETNGVWNHILALLPERALQSVWPDDYTCYVSYGLLGRILNVVTVKIVVYSILTVGFVPLTGIVFRRHQVK